ncbi:carbohydrate porin [Sphingobium aquiterrae]|uniref:carbohydrate porin n=1 Tax=Sphingobium aquiterrae TaxID=2038656 RepID=UPI003016F00F
MSAATTLASSLMLFTAQTPSPAPLQQPQPPAGSAVRPLEGGVEAATDAARLSADGSGSTPAASPPAHGPTGPGQQEGATAPGAIARFQRDNAVGKVLRQLKRGGVDLALDVVSNIAANPVGGARQGSAESHWVMGAADLDLEKLVGLADTKVHVQAAWFTGTNLGRESIGNSISFQQTWRPVSGPRLTQLNIEHDFGRVNVMVGRAAMNSYFNSSPFNCVFMSNTSCLTAYGGISNIGVTAYPNSSWTAKVRYAPSDRWYVQAGLFEYNNDLNLKGKGGLDFSLGKGTGALVAGEIGYQTTFAQERLPRRYKLGFYLNTDGGQSLFYDRNGDSAALTGLPRIMQDGDRTGLYAMVDQTIQRAPGNSRRNLALFGRLFVNTGNAAQLDWFASGGFVKTGTFKGRDDDTIGFLITDTHLSDQQLGYLRDLRAKAGGTGSPKADEIVGEINYGFAAMPGVRILPNIQWVINPDPIYVPQRKTNVPSALVLGLRIDVKFAQLFEGAS